jgi:hypothetical protein
VGSTIERRFTSEPAFKLVEVVRHGVVAYTDTNICMPNKLTLTHSDKEQRRVLCPNKTIQ